MTSINKVKFSDYLWHMRPKSWPIVFLHCALGGELALSPRLEGEWGMPQLGLIILGALLWTVFLYGGAQALDSGIDRDQGKIKKSKDDHPIPPGLTWFGLGMMVLGALLAFLLLPLTYLCLYLACIALAIIYSTPPVRLKTVAGGDLAVKMIGYGALTILAGYFSVEEQLRQVAFLAAGGFAFLFGALYPTMQIHRLQEALNAESISLTVQLGVRRSLTMACFFLGLAFAFFGAIHLLYETGSIGLAACMFSYFVWLAVLIPWAYRPRAYPPRLGMYRALWAWALTESLLAVIWLGQVLQTVA